MSRYTDVDALMQSIRRRLGIASLDNLLESEKAIVKEIDSAPSIDLVRCMECKHCSLDVCVERTVSGKERCINICNRHSTEWVVDEDWFCADAERKESE